ncbi:chemotaxis protein CheA [Methylocapsa polymorpha]|uniref:Chemotaxis protein CheA n=1 Tax=Methylocapsa polymorpha TaxID=3080828 RepID=A0ABZ0HP05_9HYPH|nr:chemotaxis protein CheA [Methylocapsa sp. RX1]
MDAMAAIKQTFFQECEEQLAELETGLLAIQDGGHDAETVNAVFRAVHSIKGGAGAFSLDDLVHFAHVFETALDHVRAGKLAPSHEVLNTMLRAADALADLVRAARDGGAVDAQRCEALADALRALDPEAISADQGAGDDDGLDEVAFQPVPIDESMFDDPPTPAEPRLNLFTIRFKPKAVLYAKANETAVLIRELARLGETTIVCDASGLPLLSELDPEGAYLAWIIELLTTQDEEAVREVFEFVEWDCDLDIESDAANASPDDIDVAALIEKMQAAVEAELSALTPPQAPQADLADGDQGVIDLAKARQQKTPQAVGEPAAQKPEQAAAGGPSQATIRVDLDRVDRLINLVGELVINQAMLAQRVLEAGLARASGVATGLDELEQLTREIQDSVMAIRAQPVKSVFQRMPRLVREVGAMTGKLVRLVTEGENTEVDKTVIERLADPLTHMIRNAIDHGLEKPETRAAAGKPEEGLVHLSAAHRSGRIVIEVSDDGAGIDRARVKTLAASKGLIPADASLSDDEIDNLIFLPGFSTASTVSDISGRGVGMDVVRRSIQALGGRISIASRPGQGSTFTMSLPLTLAVLDGMVVTVAGQTLVVPLTAIVETLQPKIADVHGFGGGTRVIAIRDQFTPLIDVGRELAYRAENADALSCVALLVEAEGGVRSALLVDAILGQRQVVIKSLEANYRHVPGIAAATILGDGRVALILDVDAVVASSRMDAAFEQLLATAG